MNQYPWIVLDDSGSQGPYSDLTLHLGNEIQKALEDWADCIRPVAYKTSHTDMHLIDIRGTRRLGDGGGDGFKRIGDTVRNRTTRVPTPGWAETPPFIIYLTDNAPNIEPAISDIFDYNILLVDVGAIAGHPSGHGHADVKVEQIVDAVLEICDIDSMHHDEECEATYCGTNVFEAQPFFPHWSRTAATRQAVMRTRADREAGTDRYLFKTFTFDFGPEKVAFFDELQKVTHQARDILGSPFKHPVDKDLDEINQSLDACKGRDVPYRAALGLDIHNRIKKIVGGNSLTPTQQTRIKCTRYRLYTVCLNMSLEQAHKAAFETDTLTTQPLDFDHTPYIPEAPGGPVMSQSQITTTVSLAVAHSNRATVKDLKTLIGEVERVGGTDESYVNFESARAGCINAVVVTAVEVTEPDLDPQVACALTIEDTAIKVRTLIDLARAGDRTVRQQAIQALTDLAATPAAKPAKKATTKTTAKA